MMLPVLAVSEFSEHMLFSSWWHPEQFDFLSKELHEDQEDKCHEPSTDTSSSLPAPRWGYLRLKEFK